MQNKLKFIFLFLLCNNALLISQKKLIDIRYFDHIGQCLCIGDTSLLITINSKAKVSQLKKFIAKNQECNASDLEAVPAMNLILSTSTKHYLSNEKKLEDFSHDIWVINKNGKCPNISNSNSQDE